LPQWPLRRISKLLPYYALIASGVVGWPVALVIDRLARWRGRPSPRERLWAALAWGLAFTAITGCWWLRAFYEAVQWLLGWPVWPREGAFALVAGWVFWSLLLSALVPSARRLREAQQPPEAPGRLAPPPKAPPIPPPARPGATAIGVAAGGKVVYCTDEQGRLHTLVLGATGAGKTNLLELLLGSAISSGDPVIVIDGKGSTGLLRRVRGLCDSAGREVRVFSFAGEDYWNPLKHGDHTHLRDLLSAIQEWNNPFFQAVGDTFLGVATYALVACGVPATLRTIMRLLSPDLVALRDLIQRIPDPELSQRLYAVCHNPDDNAKSGIAGLALRLGRLTDSQIGPWLEPAPAGARELDLIESVTAPHGPVAHFSIDALGYPATAKPLAAMVLQNLQQVAAVLMAAGNTRPISVFIDEFAPFDVQQLLGLLGRGREAGLRCVLVTQDLSDLERTGGRTAVDQVLANTGTKISLRVDVRETAERIAETVGTRPTWRATHRTTGGLRYDEGTTRLEEVGALQPSVLMQLGVGEAVLIQKHPVVSVQYVRLYLAEGARARAVPADAAAARP